jgi:hypothetical protein
MEKCGICGRNLNNYSDAYSTDCGGDCWGCIGEIEAEMGLASWPLPAEDVKAISECLNAAAFGPFFPDWEFPILFGFQRSEVQVIAKNFSASTVVTEEIKMVVQASIGNLLGYPHQMEDRWAKWISVSPERVGVAMDLWAKALGRL